VAEECWVVVLGGGVLVMRSRSCSSSVGDSWQPAASRVALVRPRKARLHFLRGQEANHILANHIVPHSFHITSSHFYLGNIHDDEASGTRTKFGQHDNKPCLPGRGRYNHTITCKHQNDIATHQLVELGTVVHSSRHDTRHLRIPCASSATPLSFLGSASTCKSLDRNLTSLCTVQKLPRNKYSLEVRPWFDVL
jgi:hypothetical protein